MKLLLISFYYPPDLGAGSFRANALSGSLKERIGESDSITILTSKPNRYADFIEKSEDKEIIENIKIIRFGLPAHNNGFIDQSISFSFFFLKVLHFVRKKRYDAVIATSSRLFTAFLAKIISSYKNIPIYLDIRDIFYEGFLDLTRNSLIRFISPVVKQVERFTFLNATKINIVSKGFEEYFKINYNNIKIATYPNGIDAKFMEYRWSMPNNHRIKIAYAGNIGDGQGLDKIIPDLAEIFSETHDFHIIGSGGRVKKLQETLADRDIKNVYLFPATNRGQLIRYYNSSDILFLHLNDFPAFKRVLPSKIFEYAATGKPIISGVSGFAKKFIEEEIDNAIVFNPCNIDQARNGIKNIDIKLVDRSYFKKKYNRKYIMDSMAEDVISHLNL